VFASPTKRTVWFAVPVLSVLNQASTADQLSIPFYTLNFEKPFEKIVDYFVREYDRGATPNPCIVCNRDLKFGKLFEYADAIGAEYVAARLRGLDAERGEPRRASRSDVEQGGRYLAIPLRGVAEGAR
jgi:tRNA-specific 2-thiouridylase